MPLNEDRALVAAVGDDALAVAFTHAKVDRPLHSKEAPRRYRDRAREEPLEQRLAQSGDVTIETERFTFDETPQAYERLVAGTLQGRAVVVPE